MTEKLDPDPKGCQDKVLDTPLVLCNNVSRCSCKERAQYVRRTGSTMEKLVRQGMLYDLYGELLTDHQRKVYGELVNDDLSLSEIAELNGITRQGAHDLIKRCDKILEGYEAKLHLLEQKLAEG